VGEEDGLHESHEGRQHEQRPPDDQQHGYRRRLVSLGPKGLLAALLALAGLLLCSAPALALSMRGHVFGSAFGSAGKGNGQFSEPAGVAVAETSGDVYVVDSGHNRVQRFTAAGAYVSQFNGGKGKVLSGPTGIAIDNSHAAAPSEDPSAGDVYVIDSGHGVIDKFSPGGVYLGRIAESPAGGPFGTLEGVAVDASGNVWVYQESGEIDTFNDAATNRFVSSRVSRGSTPEPGLAVDASGELYVNTAVGVSKLNGAGVLLTNALEYEEHASAVAVDPSSGEAYVDNGATLAAFTPGGAPVERIGAGHLSEGEAVGGGVAVNSSSDVLYVADPLASRVDVFTPEAPAAPRVDGEWAAAVGEGGARLTASVDPAGAETTYQFQYGTAGCAASPASCASAPASPADIGSSFGDQSVSVALHGLQPATTYHFRVIASSALGTVQGAERMFTTPAAPGAFALPDDRMWELVSPPDKHGAGIEAFNREGGVIEASEAGSAITYVANAPIEEAPPGNRALELTQVLSTRGTAGWISQDIATPHEVAGGEIEIGHIAEYKLFSPELSLGLVEPHGETPLAPGASERTLYLRDNTLSAPSVSPYVPLVTAANVTPGTSFGKTLNLSGATPDLGHVVVESPEALTANTVQGLSGERSLYEWAGGSLQLVSVLPDGNPASAETQTAELGYGGLVTRHAISNDGSRVIWSAGGHLYRRDTTAGRTTQLDVAQGVPEPEAAGAVFQTASADGSLVFFVDPQRLTAGSLAEEEAPDLYVYEVESGALTDLSANHETGGGVQGMIPGASEDGSSVYFVANAVLAPGAAPGGCVLESSSPSGATCNLYVVHREGAGWGASPNGRYLAFMSDRSLTGYDNVDVKSGVRDEEVFLYDTESGRLICASCNPSGARPAGILDQGSSALVASPLVDGPQIWEGRWLAGSIPGWTPAELTRALYQSRYLSDSGRLFFNSADALVPHDVNGREDVYEYEPDGEGTCQSGGGCVALISSGTSGEESAFLDASASGNDVFFLTSSRLAPQDVDASFDVYDAHVCAASAPCLGAPPAAPPPCGSTDSCRPLPPQAPLSAVASGSATFAGPGNAAAARSGATSRPTARARALASALRACARQPRRRRAACRARARARYRAARPAAHPKRGGR
jgi:hypothetical protein